jgi:hypothetical protein
MLKESLDTRSAMSQSSTWLPQAWYAKAWAAFGVFMAVPIWYHYTYVDEFRHPFVSLCALSSRSLFSEKDFWNIGVHCDNFFYLLVCHVMSWLAASVGD